MITQNLRNCRNFPFVSLCIPTYNRYDLLRTALDAARRQDYPNYEILISDNTDFAETPKWLLDTIAADTRIRYVKQPTNLGMVGNYCFLLNSSNGEYFCSLQDDDEIPRNFLSGLMAEIQKRSDIVLCGPTCQRYFEGKYWYQYDSFSNVGEDQLKRLFLLSRFAFENPWSFETLVYGIFKKSAFPENFTFGRWRGVIRFFFGLSITGSIHTSPTVKVKKFTYISDLRKYSSADYVYRYEWMNFLSRRQEERLTVLMLLTKQTLLARNIAQPFKLLLFMSFLYNYIRNKPELSAPKVPQH